MAKSKPLRSAGLVLLDIEPLILEMIDQEFQWSDVLSIFRSILNKKTNFNPSKKRSFKKNRPMGEIVNELTPLVFEMTNKHKINEEVLLDLVYAYLEVHCPSAREEYTYDGSNPLYRYGPK